MCAAPFNPSAIAYINRDTRPQGDNASSHVIALQLRLCLLIILQVLSLSLPFDLSCSKGIIFRAR
jgi:hypothetical protein